MIYRIDVAGKMADAVGNSVRQQIAEAGVAVGAVSSRRIFLIESSSPREWIERAARELLADPLVEDAIVFAALPSGDKGSRIEIHLKPGVMDPVAASTEMALRDMGIEVKEVRTGRAYLLENNVPREQLQKIASRVLANGVIESVHFEAFVPTRFETGRDYRFELRHIPLRDLSVEQLTKLSRDAHLFLSQAEMAAIQGYYREQGRDPTDIELETLAQTWSEHCVHKTLKSAVDVEVQDELGKVTGTRHYKNLIKETIFASTKELMKKEDPPFCLSVFADNAGVIAFDETDAVCFKAETHNHPSAIEPYGGSATGAGGVIRDILGTGLAAKPIANTDVFCVAFPNYGDTVGSASADAQTVPSAKADPTKDGRSETGTQLISLPRGVIHPKRILQQVVAGVRDYGNRMGIPTVNGAVYFDDRYIGNPLVFCGCVGLIPRDKIHKETKAGDAIVVMGGRTGRDGIHGATFSSAELTDTHADEFSHAVQIGNAITEKKMADVILQARDRGLFTAITDCGAGGLSSAVGEMGAALGAWVELDKVPLKYAGLRYDEIWISEAQERMVLSVPADKLDELMILSKSEDVESTVIGHFGTEKQELVLRYRGQEVGRMSMDFLHEGIPMPTRKAIVTERGAARDTGFQPVPGAPHGLKTRVTSDVKSQLLSLLAHPNIASKHWIIRQYDHEVQGGSVIKPLTGPLQIGPSDAAVLRPKLNSHRGIAIGCGLAPQIDDPYEMALAAIDEAIRNVVAVGADPGKIAILDNFCWPSVDDPRTMGTLVRACEACRDAALAYGIPFISGKDSLHNQFTNSETGQVIRIPNTLVISAIGVIEDVQKCVTMDLKRPGNRVCLIGPDNPTSLSQRVNVHRMLARAISEGVVRSCHDVSDGGSLTAAAEMSIASELGLAIVPEVENCPLFVEMPAHYLVEWDQDSDLEQMAFRTAAKSNKVTCRLFAIVSADPDIAIAIPEMNGKKIPISELRKAWRGTLDW